MSEFLKRVSALPPDRLALLAAELKTRLDRAESMLAARTEPIAVVGMGCRLPGDASSPAAYWSLLHDGVDAVTEVPSERWSAEQLYDGDPDVPGRMATRWGSFVEGLEDFDPWFFGISPREAMGMDPQHRLLLEVAWEALEHAGISPDRLDGTPTGVFLGLCNQDFHALQLERPYEEIDSYFASGVSGSMAAGRVSYLLGLQGPALTVDTACSSSLVALHLACESLRTGESRTALAAGVSLILTPETMIGLSKSRILSADGRCRTFDADAAGIARGEGCAVVVLKRLSDARADGDRVLALIRASGINQDGRSSGITAPNGAAQEALLRLTLERSGLRPDAIDYVEAHGTGTTLGDPIEVRALGAVYGQRSADHPLLVGSVKTNFGHLEATAGLAGFMKVVLALQAREIPPHLHLKTKNPHIDWDRLPIEVPTALAPWRSATADEPRRGAVSAFGFSGTNAHVILEEAPAEPGRAVQRDRSAHVLPLSARSEPVLRALVGRYADLLQRPDAPPLADVCHTAATGRATFPFRLAASGENSAAVGEALRSWLVTADSPDVRAGRAASATACEPVFVFTGQGSQTIGMGRELYETEPVFRAALDRCDAALREHLATPLLSVLYPAADAGDDAATRIDRTEYAQPALFALEFALSELWRSWGVEPVAVIGHSLGEYVAATVAGLFSVEDGLRIVARRGRLMQDLPSGGAMAAVFADVARVQAIAARHQAHLSVAAVNGPGNAVLSGDADVLDAVLAELAADGVNARRLVVSHAFHSPRMDPILAPFDELFRDVTFTEPSIPIISNLTGSAAVPSEIARADYWREHLRRPVRFMDGIRSLESMGHRTFLEIGPHPTLTGLAAACLQSEDAVLVHSLRRGRTDWSEIAAAAGALHVRGLRLDWHTFDRDRDRRTVTLPATPFERRRFWTGWSQKAHGIGGQTREAPWTWDLEWEASPIAAVPVDPAAIASRLTPRAAELVSMHGAGDYTPGLPLLDALCTALVVRGLRALGCALNTGEHLDPATLREQLGVKASHTRLFGRMLDILRQDGLLSEDGDVFVVRQAPPEKDPRRLADELNTVAPGMRAETGMTLRCGLALADVLRGHVDPLELLFPGGSTEEATDLYGNAPSFRVFNTLVRDAVTEIVAARQGFPARILEVGGGTGGVTREIMSALPRDVSYTFTDVSPLFIARARENFAAYPGFTGGVLDVSRDPAEQGHAPGSYDLVVASNVLHATPDLHETLTNLHGLLAPGGAVVVLEGVLPQRFGDMTVGLTDGWWSFTDTALRPDYALMDPDRWLRLFAECGFEVAAALPHGVPEAGVLAQQRVFIARRAAGSTTPARWVAVTGGGAASAQVIGALETTGLHVDTVSAYPETTLAARLERVLDAGGVDGVVHLVSLDAAPDATDGGTMLASLKSPAESALTIVRELVRRGGIRLALITRNAEFAAAGDVVEPAGSPLWGLARGVALEHPELRCVVLDVEADKVDGQTIAAVLRSDGIEDQFALRAARLTVPRIRQADVPAADAVRFRADAAYLVTGGLAGLGLRVARWMAERGAGTLILAARGEPGATARAEITAIEQLGTRVHVVRGDVADHAAVSAMLDAAGSVPVRGIMHAAGTTADAALASLDWDRTEGVMQAKVAGSWNLHVAGAALELDHFVMFSSGAAFLGSPGQANHAMANSFLGALAHHRRTQGRPGLTVDWGPWSEVGAATRGDVMDRARAAGLNPIEVDPGLDLLGRLMQAGSVRVAAIPVDWATYLARVPGGSGRPWFNRVRPAHTAGEALPDAAPVSRITGGADEPYLAAALAGAVAGRRAEAALDGIRAIAARVLGAGTGTDIDPGTPLTELGLDSLMAVEMRNRLAGALGRPLPATLLFNYPSLESLAGFVVQGLEPAPQTAVGAADMVRSADIDDMSEDEVADLLAEKLKNV